MSRSFQQSVRASGADLSALPARTAAAIEHAWHALAAAPNGVLAPPHHRAVRDTFGAHLRFLGEEEFEALSPERATELRQLHGRAATDTDDVPLGSSPPHRVFSYPTHRGRWPGYVREAALLVRCMGQLARRMHDPAIHGLFDALELAARTGDCASEAWHEATELEQQWESRTSEASELWAGHFGFCALDWITQSGRRPDQDDLVDIAFFAWSRSQDAVGQRRAWWEWWLLDAVPAAFGAAPIT